MIEVRHQIARNAGFDNYRDYAFKAKHRFDYTRFEEHFGRNLVTLWAMLLVYRQAFVRFNHGYCFGADVLAVHYFFRGQLSFAWTTVDGLAQISEVYFKNKRIYWHKNSK